MNSRENPTHYGILLVAKAVVRMDFSTGLIQREPAGDQPVPGGLPGEHGGTVSPAVGGGQSRGKPSGGHRPGFRGRQRV